ncbi:MAG: cell envelope integrity protein TolA [Pseudomonadota bacterium]
MSALPLRDPLMPRPPRGMGRGLVLALAVHALLVVGLSISVNWKTQTPESAEAELWASVPQVAAPRRVAPPAAQPTPTPPPPKAEAKKAEPPPPPTPKQSDLAAALKDAQIALEREKKLQAQEAQADALKQEVVRKAKLAQEKVQLKKEQLQAEKDKAQEKAKTEKLAQADKDRADKLAQAEKDKTDQAAKAKADKKKQAEEAAAKLKADKAEEDAKLATAREKQLARIVGQAGASGGPAATGTAAQSAGPSANYIGRLKGRIRPNIIFTEVLETNPQVEVRVKLAPDGRILSSTVTKPSASKAWDDAVLRALERTEVLPRDEDGKMPPTIDFTFRPRDL